MLANHHVYYRLARLTGTFKIIAIDVYCCILSGIIRRISNYMSWGPDFLFVESTTSQDHPAKRASADMELRNYPKPKHLSS